MLAKGIAAVAGDNMILGVMLMRLAVLPGLVLLVAALPGLARRLGGRIPVALWLAVASPMMVIHMVGGVHNDLLVVGLLAAGSLLVLERRPVAGIAVVTVAMAMKARPASRCRSWCSSGRRGCRAALDARREGRRGRGRGIGAGVRGLLGDRRGRARLAARRSTRRP